ncbi:Ger(x)C family spore germination protein [Paenibacillus sp. NEAU-GSW1]|nr:Ger(x)C family spore germination protein [Paenibacillus sp. NEAU-GSW1]MUT67012.1 Ger(x)C family spore germination protein [Paenibacillus sp. NEAU-GSW1]
MTALMIVSVLSGCWSRRELNALSVVLAMGIDRVGDQYEVSVQVADPSQMSRSRTTERSPSILFSEKASTLFEALRKLTTKASRRMYISHLRILIMDEQTAREGIRDPLDFLFRDHEIRPDFYMTIARDCTAKELLSLVTPMEVLPALDFYKSLKVSEKAWAPTSAVNVVEIIQKFSKDGVDPVLTGLTIIGDKEKGMKADNVKQPKSLTEYKYIGIGVLNDDRLIGWLNDSESRGFSYIANRITNTVRKVKCPQSDELFVVEVYQSKANFKPSIKDGKPKMDVKIAVEANIGEMHCQVDLTKADQFEQLQKAAKDSLKQNVVRTIENVQEKQSDVFGFGEEFHRKYPKLWHQWKQDWDRRFKEDLQVNVQIDYHLRKIGKIISPIYKKQEEKGRNE